MSPPRLLGAVLAGGAATRYGGPKASALVDGEPMVRRVARALAPVCEEVVVVSPRPEAAAGDVRRIPDRIPDRGPLGGLHAALHEARALGLDGVLLVGCDLPLVTPELLGAVAAALAAAQVAAPTREDRVETVCAAYAVGLLDEVERRLGGGELSLQGLFASVGGARVDTRLHDPHGTALTNVNTRGDRARAEAALLGTRAAGGAAP